MARFQAILHHAATVTMHVDREGRIESASGAVTRLLGHDPELIVGRPLEALAAPGFEPHLRAALHAAARMERNEPIHMEVPVEVYYQD